MRPSANTQEVSAQPDCVELRCITIDSKLEEVRLIGEAVREVAAQLQFANATLATVELAVVETVNNCIEHAYRFESDHSVEVLFTRSDTRLFVAVKDSGESLPDSKKESVLNSEPVFPDTDVETLALPEGGWGLSLIKTLADELDYSTLGSKNTITLSFDLQR